MRVLIGRGLDLSLSFSSKIIPKNVLIRFSGLFALTVGVDYGEVPPVPIPNTEVKLVRAENTWRAASRKDRSMPASAQLPRSCAELVFLLSSVGRACGC